MNDELLLDTCAAIWVVEEKLSAQSLERIFAASKKPVHLSPITGWELGLLFSRGRLRSPISPQEYLRRLMSQPHIRIADMSPELLMASSFLPGDPPRDPADRIIATTAREYGYTVITRDRALLDYAAQGHLRALEC